MIVAVGQERCVRRQVERAADDVAPESTDTTRWTVRRRGESQPLGPVPTTTTSSPTGIATSPTTGGSPSMRSSTVASRRTIRLTESSMSLRRSSARKTRAVMRRSDVKATKSIGMVARSPSGGPPPALVGPGPDGSSGHTRSARATAGRLAVVTPSAHAAQRPAIERWERSTRKRRSAETAATSDGGLVRPDLPRFAAADAVEVAVLVVGEDVELLATVGAVAVADEAELLEDVERPVDGRGDCRRVEISAAIDELAARDVTRRLREDLDERPPLRRPAQAALRRRSRTVDQATATTGDPMSAIARSIDRRVRPVLAIATALQQRQASFTLTTSPPRPPREFACSTSPAS